VEEEAEVRRGQVRGRRKSSSLGRSTGTASASRPGPVRSLFHLSLGTLSAHRPDPGTDNVCLARLPARVYAPSPATARQDQLATAFFVPAEAFESFYLSPTFSASAEREHVLGFPMREFKVRRT